MRVLYGCVGLILLCAVIIAHFCCPVYPVWLCGLCCLAGRFGGFAALDFGLFSIENRVTSLTFLYFSLNFFSNRPVH
jgi:hypothetical protein